jgi:hypothetical protein
MLLIMTSTVQRLINKLHTDSSVGFTVCDLATPQATTAIIIILPPSP